MTKKSRDSCLNILLLLQQGGAFIIGSLFISFTREGGLLEGETHLLELALRVVLQRLLLCYLLISLSLYCSLELTLLLGRQFPHCKLMPGFSVFHGAPMPGFCVILDALHFNLRGGSGCSLCLCDCRTGLLL